MKTEKFKKGFLNSLQIFRARLLLGGLGLLISLGALGPFSTPGWTGEHEDYVLEILSRRFDEKIKLLEEKKSLSEEDKKDLDYFYGDILQRIQMMKSLKSKGVNYSYPFLKMLQEKVQPQLEEIYKKQNLQSDQGNYLEQIKKDEEALRQEENELKELYQGMLKEQPSLKKVLQLMALARSETLSNGKIGDYNPHCPQEIQDSSVWGVMKVLDKINFKLEKNHPITLNLLSEYHADLLGAAEHSYSKPGTVNNTVFVAENGKRTHVYDYLKQLESEINTKTPSAMHAMDSYNQFLLLHPYGDSNGRIAEIIKDIILDRAQLPALLTPEKIALENYLFNPILGQGNIHQGLLLSLRETKQYLQVWKELLGENKDIQNVALLGPNVVTILKEKGSTGEDKKEVIISNRTYHLPLYETLPPVKGNTFLVGKNPSEAKIVITTNGWKSFGNFKPQKMVETQRMGTTGISYLFYSVLIPKGQNKVDLSFVFSYLHPGGNEVWFNNNGLNFNGNF